MMYVLYNILLHLFCIVFSPILLLLILFNLYDIRQRLGYWHLDDDPSSGEVVWFHAASMGEVTALATVVHVIKRAFPQRRIAVSTTTVTGQNRTKELIPSAEYIFLAPLDIPWAVNRVLRRLRPKAVILTETELWPNMIVRAKDRGCRIGLINGRMTERSAGRYKRGKGLIKRTLSCFDIVCVQTESDRNRFLAFGVHPERTAILGNIKFDLLRFLATLKKTDLTKESLHIAPHSKIVVAGSTRPGEEQIILSSFGTIADSQDDVVLIIAPRHMDRIGEVEQLLFKHNLNFTRRSSIHETTPVHSGIILLNTMGELSQIYSFADIAFVGGSLVPLGGHNPLEPAMWGVPVLFGPHRDNVRQICNLLIEAGGGMEIKNGAEFASTVLRLLQDQNERNMRGEAALKVVEANSGVASRTVQLLQERGVL